MVFALLLGTAAGPLPVSPAAAQETPCWFTLGFAVLREMIGTETVGECLEDERFNPANGNAEQRTTGGLLVWRKADNWTAFTDGFRTWLNEPLGVQQRPNDERFPWENDPVVPAPAATTAPASTTPAPTPAPPPASTVPVPSASSPPRSGPQGLPPVDAALRDASSRLNGPRDQLRLERVESREWSDSSLGCPQPG